MDLSFLFKRKPAHDQTRSKSLFVYGHMTKMAFTAIQGKHPLKSSLKSKANGIGVCNAALGMWALASSHK